MLSKNFFPKGTSEEEIKKLIKSEGFDSNLFSNQPGYVYEHHQHPETKLLGCLKGSMKVTVNGKEYDFEPGDKLIITGNTPHKAVVGSKGCVFFWSEKII